MINLLGTLSDINSSFLNGTSKVPDIIRKMNSDGSTNVYAENGPVIKAGITYTDLENMPIDNVNYSESIHIDIVDYITNALGDKNSLVCLGSDHAISYPIIEAHANFHSNLNILHFDAHPDLYHNCQNNPFSHASPFARIMENQLAQSLTQVGIRTLDIHHMTAMVAGSL